MTEYLTFEDARAKLREATRIVLLAETAAKEAGEHAADAEAVYRKQLAERFAHHRSAGESVESANIKARGDVVVHSRERDAAKYALNLAHEKLEGAWDSRRSLWRLIEWSREHDRPAPTQNGPAQQSFPENAPAANWP